MHGKRTELFGWWVEVVQSFRRTPIVTRLWINLAELVIYSIIVCVVEFWYLQDLVKSPPALHTIFGVALSVFLVFRTNTAYDRWWEGRKLWGQLVNDCRNLAIKARTLSRAPLFQKEFLARKLVAFSYALREHLRGRHAAHLAPSDHAGETVTNIPLQISQSVYEQIQRWNDAGQLSDIDLLVLDRHASSLMDICGGCERIRKTPISLSYALFIRQCIFIYLFTVPWGLVHDYGWWTVPAVALIGYFMIGIELIAEEVEEPFGTSEDDLALDDICRGIRESVIQIYPDVATGITDSRVEPLGDAEATLPLTQPSA